VFVVEGIGGGDRPQVPLAAAVDLSDRGTPKVWVELFEKLRSGVKRTKYARVLVFYPRRHAPEFDLGWSLR
jgi:hypothetical protein